MTRILITLVALVLTAAPVGAQVPESTTQMQLVASSVFTTRLQYVGVQIAKEVLEEVADGKAATPIVYTPACHLQRVELARAWAQSPAQMASIAAVWVAGTNEAGAVIVGTVTGAEGAKDSSASDLALKQALRFKWNAMARCVTNP